MERITKTIQNERKEQKVGFSGMLLLFLGTSLLGIMLTGKGKLRTGYRNEKGKGMLKAGYGCEYLPVKKKSNSTPSYNKF